MLLCIISITLCYILYFSKEKCNISQDCFLLNNSNCTFSRCMDNVYMWVVIILYILALIPALWFSGYYLFSKNTKNYIIFVISLIATISFPITVLLDMNSQTQSSSSCSGTVTPSGN